jgi:hypothetical protein
MCESTTTIFSCAHCPQLIKSCIIGNLLYPKAPQLCPRYKSQEWKMTGNCAECVEKTVELRRGDSVDRQGGGAVGMGCVRMM